MDNSRPASCTLDTRNRQHFVTFIEAHPASSVRTAWLYINRIAGGYDKSQQHTEIRNLIREEGLQIVEFSSPQQLADHLAAGDETQPDFVVSVGGDGTAAALATLTEGRVPIAIYPAGTENVLAKYLNIPPDFASFRKMLSRRHIQRIDAGRCGDRTFLLMLSAGFEAEVVHQVHRRRRGHLSKLHYMLPTFGALRSYPYRQLELDLELEDGSRTQTEGYWVFAFNVPRYALGFQLAPQACPEDGLLDVCVLTQKGCWATTNYITALLSGSISRRPDMKTYRVRSLRIRCPDGPVPLQIDGDPAGFTDATAQVLPSYIPLIVPPPPKAR